MSDESTSYHEAAHAVAAFDRGLPVTYLSIRPAEDSAGRTKFDTNTEGFEKLDDFSCAIIKIAGEIGARMASGDATSVREARFNWFSDSPDAEHARDFIARLDVDELDARHWAVVRAYALLRTRWEAVEEIAAKFERSTVVLGEDVSKICLAEAARRSARLAAASPPKPKVTKKPRQGTGAMERRPFKIQVKRRSTLTADPQVAEVDRQIDQLKAQLDQYPDDPPECWPLRKKLVGLHNKRQELLAQLKGAH